MNLQKLGLADVRLCREQLNVCSVAARVRGSAQPMFVAASPEQGEDGGKLFPV